jgi:RNA polymerase sigma-70 factor (ECF subfamily)
MDRLTDDELVARVLAGEGDAFAPLVGRYAEYLYRVAGRFGLAEGVIDREDVAQEAFLRAYRRLPTYAPGGRFGPWVAQIAANYCIDLLRRGQVVAIVPDRLPSRRDHRPGPEDLALAVALGDALGDALAVLPVPQARVVALVHGQGRSLGEAGAALGVPETTVKSALFRARTKLRPLLAGW